jgi:dihydrodipicolinate synthase/N-acetylneuraminate lyase
MTKNRIHGIMPAVLTPFTEDGRVDVAKLQNYLEYLTSRVHGLWICGSYGGGPLMDEQERRLVAETAVEKVGKRIPVVIHVGCPDTEQTVRLAKHAEQIGADAVASVTPYYYNHLEHYVLEHYRRLIDSVDLPVIAYNNPKCANYNISSQLLEKLAEYGLGGVKDSTGDIKVFYDYLGTINKPGFLFLIGSQNLLMPAIVGGGHCCVSGLSNLFPRFLVGIYEACKKGDYEAARKQQWQANRLRKLTGPGIPLPFYHLALREKGIDIGYPKLPFTMPSQEEQERILSELRDYLHLE